VSADVVLRPAVDADAEAWHAFLAARPEGDPLQAWPWGEAARISGERPERLIARGTDGRVRGVAQALVRPTFAGGSVLYLPHGPVWEREAPDGGDVLDALLAGLRALARRERGIVVLLEPRAALEGEAAGVDVVGALTARGLRRARRPIQLVATRMVELLDGGDQLAATWTSDARNLTGRSSREGVAVEIDRLGSSNATREFHGLLGATAERAAFRPRPRAFLEGLAAGFAAGFAAGPAGRAPIGWYTAIARREGRAIAGMALPRVGDRAFYLYGASLREPELKHVNAAYGTMAAVMRALADDGVRWLDLWGVVDPDDPSADPSWQGYSLFKRKFGGRPLRHPGVYEMVMDRPRALVRDLRDRLRGGS
jgi:lipid II:glycine glycyltransferase (peptidoglycan interpeptide bridge formation enzyme)